MATIAMIAVLRIFAEEDNVGSTNVVDGLVGGWRFGCGKWRLRYHLVIACHLVMRAEALEKRPEDIVHGAAEQDAVRERAVEPVVDRNGHAFPPEWAFGPAVLVEEGIDP